MSLSIVDKLKRRSASFIRVGQSPLSLEKPCLSLTIDDFPQNAWDNGRSILGDFGTKATFYVSGGFCNQVRLGLQQYNLKTLGEVHQAGHEIGCHTFDHYNACQVPLRRFLSSIERNAEFFKRHLPGVEIGSFAYPYGDMTALTKIALAKRFSSCRGAMHGINSNTAQAGNLLCVCLQLNDMWRYDLETT
ncbi:polysaccharide deacetylase family protein [Rhizobium sp. NTR19]|uniref:Chitooligosaccharide deacetylase n=1 Tax=Neorhizobium turbinariae TaxID=2937795 RepID=A0ABT0IQA3_9HYPH|nr:polysaccharide deacetylase family protein [Neorhizobium turbinariae]MCK8780033.1 polysaccharide deacetylase family protein [Neorhizobium turbinariae]